MSRHRPGARVARRTLPALAAAAALAPLALAGCAQEAPADPAPPASPGASAPPASGQPQDEETPEALPDPTCETIIPEEVVEQFESVGWTAQAEEFRIGATVVPDGIQCVWGDYSVATDHVQIFGWAPLDAETAAGLQAELETQGWIREEQDGAVFLTEDPAYAIATDDEGYGMTYGFGDGWVALADTKQSLVLVSWPPA